MVVGATLALWSVAVLVGRGAGRRVNPRAMRKVAAALFALVGVALVWGCC
jgi:putative Ca2+/H+ antiporter (TMEM165/GDT1 family)